MRSIARGYSRAFSRARRLIYIEDQYFWSDLVAQTLAEALRREPGLHVIAVVPRYPEDDGYLSGAPMRLGQQKAYDAAAAGRWGPLRAVRPREPSRHAGLRPREGLHRGRRVDDLRLRQPQPPVLDPRLRAHLRRGRPEWPPASSSCGCRCGPSTSGCRPTTHGSWTSAVRASSGRNVARSRTAASDRTQCRASHDGPGSWAEPAYRLVRRPRRPTPCAQANERASEPKTCPIHATNSRDAQGRGPFGTAGKCRGSRAGSASTSAWWVLVYMPTRPAPVWEQGAGAALGGVSVSQHIAVRRALLRCSIAGPAEVC